jgi:hypothetical protein
MSAIDFQCMTVGGKISGPSHVVLHTIGTDGRIRGSVPGLLSSTSWKENGQHNTFVDLDLFRSDVAAFCLAVERGERGRE